MHESLRARTKLGFLGQPDAHMNGGVSLDEHSASCGRGGRGTSQPPSPVTVSCQAVMYLIPSSSPACPCYFLFVPNDCDAELLHLSHTQVERVTLSAVRPHTLQVFRCHPARPAFVGQNLQPKKVTLRFGRSPADRRESDTKVKNTRDRNFHFSPLLLPPRDLSLFFNT